MPFEFRTRRRIEFVDTDMAGIVHFSNFFRFMEAAEHDFFRSLGVLMHRQDATRMRGFARVHAECDFQRPLHCYDEVEIHLIVARVGESSITYRFTFTRTEDRGVPAEHLLVARGSIVVVSIERTAGGRDIRRVPIDASFRALIDDAPNEPPPENP